MKRMMEIYGLDVLRLHSRRLGFLTVNDLNIGEYRLLNPYEVKRLRRLAEEGRYKIASFEINDLPLKKSVI